MRILLLICLIVTIVKGDLNYQNNNDNNYDGIQFNSELFKFASLEKQENLIMSPYSVYLTMLMLSYGANGQTKKEMTSVLSYPNFANYDSISKKLNDFNKIKDIDVKIANSLFIDNNHHVYIPFNNIVKNVFLSEIMSFDKNNLDEVAKAINSWVELRTNNKIKDAVQKEDIEESNLFLLNAIYFKAQWKYKFNKSLTKERPFYLNNGQIKNVTTMYLDTELPVAHFEHSKIVYLPYSADNFTMILQVPDVNNKNNHEEMFKDLRSIINQDDSINVIEKQVTLLLPKFNITSKINLQKPLENVGIKSLFRESQDLTNIIDGSAAKVNKILQKAFIEVNEEGTEAAADTSSSITLLSADNAPETIKVDRPSYFYIVHDRTLLFAGRLSDPS